ncbi:Uncharacterized protein Fot_21275 [Forsythia ovata]|uniref:Uncharacterized protein n=1 Tax=Forsythia ovata TaxID=205694 RepID=A0ABD1UUD5_9LAMI
MSGFLSYFSGKVTKERRQGEESEAKLGFHWPEIVRWLRYVMVANPNLNPKAKSINKAHRTTAVLENQEEGEKYAQHSLRKFLRTRPPEVMPTINRFFSDNE